MPQLFIGRTPRPYAVFRSRDTVSVQAPYSGVRPRLAPAPFKACAGKRPSSRSSEALAQSVKGIRSAGISAEASGTGRCFRKTPQRVSYLLTFPAEPQPRRVYIKFPRPPCSLSHQFIIADAHEKATLAGRRLSHVDSRVNPCYNNKISISSSWPRWSKYLQIRMATRFMIKQIIDNMSKGYPVRRTSETNA